MGAEQSSGCAELRFLHSRSNLGSCAEIEMSISGDWSGWNTGEIESRMSGVACGSCALLSSSMPSMAQSSPSSRQWWGATGGEGTSGECGSSLESDS